MSPWLYIGSYLGAGVLYFCLWIVMEILSLTFRETHREAMALSRKGGEDEDEDEDEDSLGRRVFDLIKAMPFFVALWPFWAGANLVLAIGSGRTLHHYWCDSDGDS